MQEQLKLKDQIITLTDDDFGSWISTGLSMSTICRLCSYRVKEKMNDMYIVV
jgi:hypothetical protein